RFGRRGDGECEGNGVARGVSGVHPPERRQGADHQSRSDKEDKGEGDLGGDKGALESMAPAAGSAPAFAEDLLERDASAVQRGGQSEEYGGEERGAEREQQHVGVKAHLLGARKRTREQAEDGSGCEEGEEQANHAAESGEQQTFCQQLREDASAARTQCGANSEFLAAPRATRQQKASDVGAGDEQQESDGGEQNC